MDIIPHPAVKTGIEPGATVTALLDELPDVTFAIQLQDAINAEPVRFYSLGLRHGGNNAMKAIDDAWSELGLEKPKATTPPRPKFQVLLGGAR